MSIIQATRSLDSFSKFRSPLASLWRGFRSSACHMQMAKQGPMTVGKQSSMTLPFNEFRQWTFKLKNRGRLTGVPMGLLLGWTSSMVWLYKYPYMFAPDQEPGFDPNKPTLIMDTVDPLIAMILSNIAAMAVGFSLGGTVFRRTWSMFNKDLYKQINRRSADFHTRLDKHRVLAIQRQGEDFYGEKIHNLVDYRRWVKAQRFKLKPVDLERFTLATPTL